ncbi:MAG: hypothetical protein HQK75_12905 [Candidatus Magnetomorum sp.]|nr:hypothetical protein [Candidatus Magnetomorum sp.]
MKMDPKDYIPNDIWIALRVNDSFITVAGEPYDVHVLMDAGSCYVFGFVFSKVVDNTPPEQEVEDLFEKAWSMKRQWARKLIVPENYFAKDVFEKQAIKHGLSFETVSVSDLSLIVGPLKQSFEEDFLRQPESCLNC